MRILFMTAPQAREAFDAASGEIYASSLAAGAQSAHEHLGRLLRAGEDAAEGWRLTGSSRLRTNSLTADGNAAQADQDEVGFDLGLEYGRPDGNWAAGLSAGVLTGDVDVAARGSTADLDGWRVGGFARVGRSDVGLSIGVAADYSKMTGSVTRDIAFAGLSRRATAADVEIETLGIGAEARFAVPLGGRWTAGPLATLTHVEAELGGFSETGAQSLNLRGTGASHQTSQLGAGLFATYAGERSRISAALRGLAGDGDPTAVLLRLAGAEDTPFTILSPHAGETGVQFNLTGSLDLGGGWTVGAAVDALAGEGRTSASGNLRLTFRF